MEYGRKRIEHHQKDDRTDDIEIKMHHRRTLGIGGSADTGKQRRYAGTDVLAHDNGDRRGKRQHPANGQSLQNTDRSRGGLKNRRNHGAGQNPQYGIGKFDQQSAEGFTFRQWFHRTGHKIHTEHQNSESQKNRTDIFGFIAF